MWFSAIKLALSAGSHIYKKRQETKMAMADAQYMHAQKMARGEETYQGKLLESRDKDYKDEVVLAILTLPIIVLAYGVWSDDRGRFSDSHTAHNRACLWGLVGRSGRYDQDKSLF